MSEFRQHLLSHKNIITKNIEKKVAFKLECGFMLNLQGSFFELLFYHAQAALYIYFTSIHLLNKYLPNDFPQSCF